MTDLVPADSIEQIVGRRRHPTDHIARRIGQTVSRFEGCRRKIADAPSGADQ